MNQSRWEVLMKNDDLVLTEEEIKLGWHFCWDWDGLLISPAMKEIESCTCEPYETNL